MALVVGARVILAIVVIACVAARDAQAKTAGVQGPWAFSQKPDQEGVEHLATTPSIQDPDTWLLVACGANQNLVVALMHASGTAPPFEASPRLNLRSAAFSGLRIGARRLQADEIVMDPALMRRVLPVVLDDERVIISVTEKNGAVREYTFRLQPNDVALAPIRAHCLNTDGDT